MDAMEKFIVGVKTDQISGESTQSSMQEDQNEISSRPSEAIVTKVKSMTFRDFDIANRTTNRVDPITASLEPPKMSAIAPNEYKSAVADGLAQSIDNRAIGQEGTAGGVHGVHVFDSGQVGGQDLPAWRFICLSCGLCIGLFLSFMDGSITATALYTIGRDFHTPVSITWVALAYTLSDVGFAVLFTTVADIIGRFNAYLIAQAIFLAFSIASGFAQSLDQLIAFRVFQGIGGSGLYSLAMVIWPEMSSLALKKWIGAFVGLVVAAAGVAGPILGGVLTSQASWRWIFWINPPILVVSTILFVISWPRSGIRHHELQSIRMLDRKGCFLLTAACVLPVFAFEEAGARLGTFSGGIFIGPLVGGLGSWVILIGWECFITYRWPNRYNPIFPPSLLRNRRYAANAANSLLIGFGFFVVIYNVPMRLQAVNGKSPLGAGVALLPMLGSTAFGSFLAGALSSGFDFLCATITAGSALMAVGCGLLSTLSDSPELQTKLYGFQVLVGLGFGLTVSSASILANVECELKDHATAQGIVAQARVFGGSLGIAAATAILGQKIKEHQLSNVVQQGLLQDLHTLSEAQRQAVRSAYGEAFDKALWITAIIACVAFLSALMTWNGSKIRLTDRVILQEQREDARINALREKKRAESSQGGGHLTPPPAYA